MLTNPPPSPGGILIAFALALLERAGGASDVESVVGAMEEAQAERTEEFLAGLYDEGFAARFLASDRLGSTTHITALDGDGDVRERHLLERHRLGPRSSRGPASTSTTCSASRTSTRSASTSTTRAGACRR